MREDWIECSFGEIAIIYNGDSINAQIKKDKYQKITNGLNYIGTKDIDYDGTINYINGVKIPVNESKFKVAPKGCVLVCSEGGSAGRKTAYVGEDICFGNKLYAITNEYSVFEGKYIYYYTRFRKFFEDFKNQMNGIIGGVSANKFSEILFPLAPLPLQRAIVSKIETLFSDLDNGIANFKKAQAQLKIYRQAVLKKAFEGRFTNENVVIGELPKGWKWVNSGELFSFVTSGSRGWAKYYSERGSIFIRITNLNFDTLSLDLRDEKIQYVNPPQNSEGLRTKVEEGDFLFSITGYLGMFAIAPKLESAFVNQHVCLCRPKDFFNKKYLAYWIIAKSGGHYYLNKNQKGAVKAGLNLDDLKNFPVPLPSTLTEQTQIVQEIERRLSVCDKMEQSIKESIEKAEALRQSILKKAFEGKLLSQSEIALCKKEADYEPASELLKKIKAEKLAKEQAKQKRFLSPKSKE